MFSKWTARWGAAQKTGQATSAEAPASAAPEHLRTGSAAEDLALAHLQQQGLKLVARNYRLARGRSRRAGEIDLILRDRDGTLVFVEVRARRGTGHGGAAASVTWAKQQKLRLAAHHYLLQWPELPPCRFDVVAVDDGRIEWLKAAFEAA